MSLQQQMNTLNIQDTTSTQPTPTKSISQLEIDNAYLKQQNEHLTKELSFTRYTINALKGITNQRDVTLNETRLELERALQHIQLLSYTLKQQQRYSGNSLSGIGPQLINDNESSSDDQELSGEEDNEDTYINTNAGSGRPTMDIMSKLPLRHQPPNQIYINELEY